MKYPDNTNHKIDDIDITYTISPDCKQCIGATDPAYNNKAYYMSGDIFSCYWPLNDNIITNNQNQCIMDEDGYSECAKCHNKINDKVYYAANCGSMIYDTNTPIFKNHYRCMENQQPNKLPSIGMIHDLIITPRVVYMNVFLRFCGLSEYKYVQHRRQWGILCML